MVPKGHGLGLSDGNLLLFSPSDWHHINALPEWLGTEAKAMNGPRWAFKLSICFERIVNLNRRALKQNPSQSHWQSPAKFDTFQLSEREKLCQPSGVLRWQRSNTFWQCRARDENKHEKLVRLIKGIRGTSRRLPSLVHCSLEAFVLGRQILSFGPDRGIESFVCITFRHTQGRWVHKAFLYLPDGFGTHSRRSLDGSVFLSMANLCEDYGFVCDEGSRALNPKWSIDMLFTLARNIFFMSVWINRGDDKWSNTTEECFRQFFCVRDGGLDKSTPELSPRGGRKSLKTFREVEKILRQIF